MKLGRTATFIAGVTVAGALAATAALAAPGDATWHLERITERANSIDGTVTRPALTGAGVDIYVVDEYVRPTHVEYAGRVGPGLDLVGGSVDPAYCTGGHGTHVAGLAAGATRGVAVGARIIPVRVLDCDGEGDIADVVSALRWIARRQPSGRLAVVNLSLGLNPGSYSTDMEAAIEDLVADGIVVVLAAGNGDASDNGVNACNSSPARTAVALTVGATTRSDALASYSNFGSCVDLFAPGGSTAPGGTSVESSWSSGDNDYQVQSGTSMASPLVAGFVALLAGQQPSLCPAQVAAAVVERATTGVITGLDAASPNRLLYLDTAPITSVTVPGRPTNVLASVGNGSMFATWDPPCTGGADLTGYRVVVRSSGRIVRTLDVPASAGSVRIRKLRNGVAYSVTVRAISAVGEGPVSERSAVMTPRRLSVGSSTRATAVLRDRQGFAGRWTVASGSRSVCRIANSPQRLVVRRAGTCVVNVTPRDAAQQVVHRIFVG